jgi:hypothetical protein
MNEGESSGCVAGIAIALAVLAIIAAVARIGLYDLDTQGTYLVATEMKKTIAVSAPVLDPAKAREMYALCTDALGDKKFCFEKYYK